MNKKIAQLAERRAYLKFRIANQRMALAEAVAPFRGPLAILDKGLQAFRYLAKHTALVAGIVAFAAVIRPNRWLFMLEKGWMVWRLASAARRKIE
jgi:hypothetical protein